jgi:hypothetical protein
MEPALVGLLFADRVITENTGKKGIIGTFNRFFSPQFPVNFPPWAIYAAVTNIQGNHQFTLNLVHNDTDQVIVPIQGNFDIPSVNDIAELVFNINNAVFPQEGKCILSFLIDNEVIGSRTLFVDKIIQEKN